ncbi:lactadherin-like [Dendronephthya gigantea]|uniref:lactadherin-like n=1 Tax=Dendronephthya gigantea TaxID=151771 RepID=UPI00106A4C81|nr:lactadherin-like [Dendronephthya gigantea]
MGIEDGRVQDSQLSVSSYISQNLDAKSSRLNTPRAWRADLGDSKPWIQVDFLRPVTVTKVITQGREDSGQWVKEYRVRSRIGEGTWTSVSDSSGAPKDFTGNRNDKSPVTRDLPSPVTNQIFRITARTWSKYCTMRFELVGCYPGKESKCSPSSLISSENWTNWLVPSSCRDRAALGFENGLIQDSQITASSFSSSRTTPQLARLNQQISGRDLDGWRAAPADSAPWLQVDFIAKVIVEGVQTQGLVDTVMFVKTYELHYSDDGYSFMGYNETQGAPKVFNGNTDSSTVVQNEISPTIARYFRIKPLTWEHLCGFRVEFIGCYKDCVSSKALGLEDETIEKTQLMSSSSKGDRYSKKYARLNSNDCCGWQPNESDLDPWFGVDLLKDALISGVATQGDVSDKLWTKKFKFSYSTDGENFAFYKFNGGVKTFQANNDASSVVKHNLPSHIYAQFVRFHPVSCNQACVLRAEIYGCFDGRF